MTEVGSEELPSGNHCLNKEVRVKLRQREQVITRLKSLLDNGETINMMSTHQLQVKLALIDRQYEVFDQLQSELEMLDETQLEASHRTNFEDSFVEVKALILSRLEVLQAGGHESHLSSTRITHHNKVKLPQLQLTKFSGEQRDWLDFFNMFMTLVHNNDEISAVEKLQHLRSCIVGKASQVIQSLEVTPGNYQRALDLLIARYNNKRLIFQSHLQNIFDAQKVCKHNASALRNYVDLINANLRAMQSCANRTQIGDGILLHLVLSKLDVETHSKWEEFLASSGDASSFKLPAWEDFASFLERHCQAIDIVNSNNSQKPNQSPLRSSASANNRMSKSSTLIVSKASCNLCEEPVYHNAFKCAKFVALGPVERYQLVKRKKLCLNCLGTEHMATSCTSSHRCQECKATHHTLLHREQASSAPTISSSPTEVQQPSVALQAGHLGSEVIIATALVKLSNNKGVTTLARVLLDSASQLNFITERTAKFLRVNRQKNSVQITGIGNSNSGAHHCCTVSLSSLYGAYSTNLETIIIPTITTYQPNRLISIEKWNLPKNIFFADQSFNKPGPIDMLIGAGLFYNLLMVGQIQIDPTQIILQKTVLGWIVSGAMNRKAGLSSPSLNLLASSLIQSEDTSIKPPQQDLSQLLDRFWIVENLNTSTPSPITKEEEACENYFQATTRRCPETGKFIVRLPFRESPTTLGQSFEIAKKRLHSVEKQIHQKNDINMSYLDFMKEYSDLNHMTLIDLPDSEVERLNFIPHHCVINPDSSTTKLRVVFDASCRTDNGKSLNEILRVGPTLQDDLFTILLRFRLHRYVLVADIAKMYRQIFIDDQDSQWQCILWRESPGQRIRCYRLRTVTYGTSCAPFLAIRSLRQLAVENALTFPIGSEVTLRDFYVDNLLTGASTVEEVKEIKQQVVKLLDLGGFPLKRFASNNDTIIAEVPESDREAQVQVKDFTYIKTLGLKWSPKDDTFRFLYSTPKHKSSRVTKRIILAHIAGFFDPLGLLNPLVVAGKILMQELWKLRLDWDESVPAVIHTQWQNLCQELAAATQIRIPRFVEFNPNVDIHAFADASKRAYGACVYVVSRDSNPASCLLCAKSRVAPTKEISLPRLELCAALLLAELLDGIIRVIAHKPHRVYCWTDSTIVLAWIHSEPSRWTTFVANRVTKIQQYTSQFSWHHVPSVLNPADMVSRGSSVTTLLNNSFWVSGPPFLLDYSEWPISSMEYTQCLPEQRKKTCLLVSKENVDELANHKFINNYNKFLRTFAYVKRFITILRKNQTVAVGPITAEELTETLHTICAAIQRQSFPQEYKDLRQNHTLSAHSKLLSLSPFLHNDLIRVGGRITHSALSFQARHPILLPKSHPFVYTLISYHHRAHLHAGGQTLLAILRNNFWIINARTVIRKVLRCCIRCYRCKPIISEQVMGALPADRVTQSPPFEITGIDYCGPLLITHRIRGRDPQKVYLSIFICFATKAVHIEVVTDLTTNSFLAALKRFVSRRGKCRIIYSDNATNFVGANRELRDLLTAFMTDHHYVSVCRACRDDGIIWKFIPPRSPHFGGLWESAVKQAKQYLRRAVGTHLLTLEELQTVCCQIEAMINSRPLTPLSNDPSDCEALTPAHFLIGKPLVTVPEPSLLNQNITRLRRYQLVQWIQQYFWERWSNDYIKQLQIRTKWKINHPNLRKDDLVLIKEETTPPLKWAMGRVVEPIKGADGMVRVAVIKTSAGLQKRTITKLCKLPVESTTTTN